MEKRIPVTNNTAMAITVGGHLVPPGETRDFAESQVPQHLRPPPESVAAPVDSDPLLSLLEHAVKDVVAKFGDLSDAEIAHLLELEEAGQARKTLVEALGKDLADRTLDAAVLALLSGEAEQVIAALPGISAAEIARLLEIEADAANREAILTAAAAEQLKRKG